MSRICLNILEVSKSGYLYLSLLLSITNYNFYHLPFFIITHGALDIADPSSMQDACHKRTQ